MYHRSEKILTFSLGRGFALVLSFGVTTQLTTSAIGLNWPCILQKECFDIMTNIGFGDLGRLFSNSR